MNISRQEAYRLARELGATHEGHYMTACWKGEELYAIHYFNKEGEEVMYWVRWGGMMLTFETPRKWADEIKSELRMYAMQQKAA
jgi:hypothetical protein